jgi:hypothetical protein
MATGNETCVLEAAGSGETRKDVATRTESRKPERIFRDDWYVGSDTFMSFS